MRWCSVCHKGYSNEEGNLFTVPKDENTRTNKIVPLVPPDVGQHTSKLVKATAQPYKELTKRIEREKELLVVQ